MSAILPTVQNPKIVSADEKVGYTARDLLAAMIGAPLLAGLPPTLPNAGNLKQAQVIGESAYKYADAFLKGRTK